MKVTGFKINDGWKDALTAARLTANKEPLDKEPSDKFKRNMLRAEHSPIRLVEFTWTWQGIKSWVATHFVRHHIGIEKFVATQRHDRTDNPIPRDEIAQGALVDMMCRANAQAMINISRKRLCGKASRETREAWKAVLAELKKADELTYDACVPECVYRGFCPESESCGYSKTQAFELSLESYRYGNQSMTEEIHTYLKAQPWYHAFEKYLHREKYLYENNKNADVKECIKAWGKNLILYSFVWDETEEDFFAWSAIDEDYRKFYNDLWKKKLESK